MKPIHNIGIELCKSLANYTVQSLAEYITDGVLFGLISLSENRKKNIQLDMDLNIDYSKTPDVPFLPNTEMTTIYTLVLDLDETLIHHFHTTSGGTFICRPGMLAFLKELSCFYEIVVFTAGTKDVIFI